MANCDNLLCVKDAMINGYTAHIFPADHLLCRGSKHDNRMNEFVWFADAILVAKEYGTSKEACRCYVSNQDILLFDASNIENIEKLLSVVPDETDKTIIKLVTGYGISDLLAYIFKLKKEQYETLHPPPVRTSVRSLRSKPKENEEQLRQKIEQQEYPDVSSVIMYQKEPNTLYLSPVGFFEENDSKKIGKLTSNYLNKRYAKILHKYVGTNFHGWIYPFGSNVRDASNPTVPFKHEIMLFKPKEVLYPVDPRNHCGPRP